jgi:glucosamine-6-phosphate deaminase
MTVDLLTVHIAPDTHSMGSLAAKAIAADIKAIAEKKPYVRIMFAAAPSQDSTLEALQVIEGVPWSQIIAFHMDEYVGIESSQPQSFRNYLTKRLFDNKPFKNVHLIAGDAQDPQAEADHYESLLREAPLDIVILGIGENGHIAFNDPPDANFQDDRLVRIITLSEESRVQQVHDGCFKQLGNVPKTAITVTIPAFLNASILHCVVPNQRKAEAVKQTLYGPINSTCPASVLRMHPHANLYLDSMSASLL